MDTLETAVKEALGEGWEDMLDDVADYGADGGFPGFTYYNETCKFYADNKDEINQLVENMAEELGEEPISMVQGFNCIKGDFNQKEIAQTMYGNRTKEEENDLCQIDNALAWFALEEIANRNQ